MHFVKSWLASDWLWLPSLPHGGFTLGELHLNIYIESKITRVCILCLHFILSGLQYNINEFLCQGFAHKTTVSMSSCIINLVRQYVIQPSNKQIVVWSIS